MVATSSAEAELYARGKVASESSGAKTLLAGLGSTTTVSNYFDSSVALALTQRTGLGKAKHIEVQRLWVQEAVKAVRIPCTKWPGGNPGGLGVQSPRS